MKELFHGSDVKIEQPLVNVGRKTLDFGPGFYLTTLRYQAERWSRRVCFVRNSSTPVIGRYLFDDVGVLQEGFKRLLFDAYDQKWLDFIVASRRGEEPWRGYDMIEGGVANDQVIDTVEDYYSGRITAGQAIGQLRYAKPTHQICISSQAVVDAFLKFTECYYLDV